MSKMDFVFNLSPLNTTVSRKVISFSDISAVDLIVGWNLFGGEDIVNISSPFFWLGFALLFQRCFNFSHENIGK